MSETAEGPDRAGAVLTAAAGASTFYTADAAKGAATALVRMFMEQGVFGIDVTAGVPGSDPEPHTDPAAHVRDVPEPTPWEHARSAVDLAERRRTAAAKEPKEPKEPKVTSVRLMGDIIGRTGQPEPATRDPHAPAALPVRAA